jgi:hypothetical protein
LAISAIALDLILAAGALGGGLALMLGPRGEVLPLPLSLLEGSPFQTYFVPGLILFAVLGLGAGLASLAGWRRHPLAPLLTVAVGVALLGWMIVEIVIVGYSNEPPLQAIYLTLGVVLSGIGLAWLRSTRWPGKRRPSWSGAAATDDLTLVYRLSILLGLLLVGSSAVGLATGMGSLYEPYPTAEAGLFAQDLVILVGAVPLLGLAMRMTLRASAAGRLLWAGTLFYVAYTYFFMVIGAFTVLFPVYLAIVGLATFATLALLFRTDAAAIAAQFWDRTPRRSVAGFFGITVAVFAILWGGLVASTLAAGGSLSAVQHLVVVADGAVLLPILAYAAVGLWRRHDSGYVLGGMLLVKAGLTGFTLAFTGTVAMATSGVWDPAEAVLVGIFTVMALASIALWAAFVRAIRTAGGAETDLPATPSRVASPSVST